MSAHEDLLRGKAVTLKHSLDLHHVARALQDIPEDARDQLNEIGSAPKGTLLWRRIADELENAGLDASATLSESRCRTSYRIIRSSHILTIFHR